MTHPVEAIVLKALRRRMPCAPKEAAEDVVADVYAAGYGFYRRHQRTPAEQAELETQGVVVYGCPDDNDVAVAPI